MAKDKCIPPQRKQYPRSFNDRLAFKSQLLSKQAVKITTNTTYEEIGCAGFQPEFNRLEAVVYIKQPVGYSGSICSTGSNEYVRFYLSYDNGTTWEDQGITSFTAYDIPQAEDNRLEYAVTLEIDPKKRFCFLDNLILARAILSWNLEPPPDDPDFTPPWGNVHDTHIQIDPFKLIPMHELLMEAQVVLPPEISEVIDLSESIPVLKKKTLTIDELQTLYKKKGVEEHRFGFSLAQKILSDPDFNASLVGGVKGSFAQAQIDWSQIIDAVISLDGNTSYEELECVGLNPDTSELIATLRTKRPYGFSGGPCTNGSTEYVTFWGDFDMDGTYEVCLGTSRVDVYDFNDIPEEGLEYSVFLPVDLNPYRQPCQDGPKVARIRAILSWNTPHPCSLPNEAPYWGNTEDTVIQIPAGPSLEGDDLYRPYMYTLCSRNVCTIDQGTGLSTGDRPFGGVIWIKGEIPAGPAITTPDRFKYKVQVRPASSPTWQTLDNDFWIWITEGSGIGPASTSQLKQQVDLQGYYTYREFGTPISGNWRRVTGPNRALARWATTSSDTGLWEIRMEAVDTVTDITYAAGVQICPNGTTRQNVIVKLEQERPEIVDFRITHYERDGTTYPASDCGKFMVGDTIHGTYEVSDEHFRVLTLKVLPRDAADYMPVDPSSRTYYAPDFVPTTGESGTWSLTTKTETKEMAPCGYVVLLEVWDRTIYSCNANGRYARDSVGFCLEEPVAQ